MQTSLCFHKLGTSGTKIADRLGFSQHMKTRLTCKCVIHLLFSQGALDSPRSRHLGLSFLTSDATQRKGCVFYHVCWGSGNLLYAWQMDDKDGPQRLIRRWESHNIYLKSCQFATLHQNIFSKFAFKIVYLFRAPTES